MPCYAGGRGCNFILQSCFALNELFNGSIQNPHPCRIYTLDHSKIHVFKAETTERVICDSKEFFRKLKNARQVVIITGLGGNTGGMTTAMLCSYLTQNKVRTTVIASLPFPFEGVSKRKKGFIQLQEIEKRCMDNDALVLHYENLQVDDRHAFTIEEYFIEDNKKIRVTLLTILNSQEWHTGDSQDLYLDKPA